MAKSCGGNRLGTLNKKHSHQGVLRCAHKTKTMDTIVDYYMALGTYVVLIALGYAVYRYFRAVCRK